MTGYQILTFLIGISALFAYINQRFIKLPFTIGLFLISMICSLIILTSRYWGNHIFDETKVLVQSIDIGRYILEYMLGFMLFAGSLHTSWTDIKKLWKPISTFSFFGVIFSTFFIGYGVYLLSLFLAVPISFIYCLLFGALMSPTDPIAVLSILTKANVPKKIETTIVGESLFNDGIGVVVFIVILEVLNSGEMNFDISRVGVVFIRESIGGISFGLITGLILHKLISTIDHYESEVLLSLAFVMTGYSLCMHFHFSGPLAMVIMGLFVGNYTLNNSVSDTTLEYVNKFWELIDLIFNAILFVIISFVMVEMDFQLIYILLSIATLLVVLISRIIVIRLPIFLFPSFFNFTNKESQIIIWGGLRGGLSIALALSLPVGLEKNIILILTYICVVFSILTQGLTIGRISKSQ